MPKQLSRRKLLKQSLVAGGATIAATRATQVTQAAQATQGGPAVITGRRFRAWISRGDGPKRTTLQEVSLKPISVAGTRRIVEYAFEYALRHGRRKVTAVTKANIMKYTDGLFLRVAREVAAAYEGRIDYEEMLVDAVSMRLVMEPKHFDVLVMPNLYGDILSDLCAGLIGGIGIAPGMNVGADGVGLRGRAGRRGGPRLRRPGRGCIHGAARGRGVTISPKGHGRNAGRVVHRLGRRRLADAQALRSANGTPGAVDRGAAPGQRGW